MSRRRSGFNLFQLLTATAVVATLIGLLMPAVNRFRDIATRSGRAPEARQAGPARDGGPAAFRSGSRVILEAKSW